MTDRPDQPPSDPPYYGPPPTVPGGTYGPGPVPPPATPYTGEYGSGPTPPPYGAPSPYGPPPSYGAPPPYGAPAPPYGTPSPYGGPPPGRPKKWYQRPGLMIPLIAGGGVLALVLVVVLIVAAVGSGVRSSTSRATVALSFPSTFPTDTPTAGSASPTATDFPSTSPSAAASGNTDLAYGTPVGVKSGTSGGSATIVVNGVTVGAKPNNDFETPDNGQYVVVDISVTGVDGSFHYNPFDFVVQDAQSRNWQPGFADFEPQLNDGQTSPGQTTRGNIVFDMGPDPARVQLMSGGFGSGSVVASWKIS